MNLKSDVSSRTKPRLAALGLLDLVVPKGDARVDVRALSLAREAMAYASPLADAIFAILGDNEMIELMNKGILSLANVAETLTTVADRLDVPRSLRASEDLIHVMRKANTMLKVTQPEQLRIALVSVCQRLDAAGAARVAEAVAAAARDPQTSVEARNVLADVPLTLGDRLDPGLRQPGRPGGPEGPRPVFARGTARAGSGTRRALRTAAHRGA